MKQNIQTLAAHHTWPKLKKHEAAELVEALYHNRDNVDDNQLAQLYKFFMPALPKKAKTDFQWLAKAADKGTLRPNLNYIYCDGKNAVATDGQRMHWLSCNIPEGFYDYLQNKIEWDHTFPDWKRVIPDYEYSETLDIGSCEMGKTTGNGFIVYIIKGRSFDKRLVDDVMNGELTATIEYNNDGMQPIKFTIGTRNAMVMPMTEGIT